MTKDEAKKAVETLKTTPEPRATRNKQIDFVKLSNTTFRTTKK